MKHLQKFKRKLIYFVIFASLIFKLLFLVFRSKKIKGVYDNFQKFIKEEEKEAEKFIEGKESLDDYCHDSNTIFKDYFIPYECNGHKPKILRTKPLIIITVLLLLLKISVTGYLFLLYPNKAEMQNKITADVLALINEDRIKNNLAPLELNDTLSASATLKADDMLNKNYFSHYSPDGKTPWDWVKRSEYPYLLFGENLAMNFSSAKSAHKALMSSTSHKKNIMNDKYNEIGLAVTTGKINGKETSILVEFFAKRTKPAVTAVAKKTGEEAKEVVSNKIETIVLPAVDENIKPTALGIEKEAPKEEAPKEVKEIEKIEEVIPSEEPKSETLPLAIETKEEAKEKINIVSDFNNGGIDTQIQYFEPETEKNVGTVASVINISRYIYIGVLIFMVIALLLNIFIKLTVQHKFVIMQTLFVIVLIVGLISVRLHTLENIVDKVAVL